MGCRLRNGDWTFLRSMAFQKDGNLASKLMIPTSLPEEQPLSRSLKILSAKGQMLTFRLCDPNSPLASAIVDSLESPLDQSILKEINPEYSLEELTLKLKLQYFDHLM